MKSKPNLSGRIILTILRIFVGGHLFFQGMIKLVSPTWTSQAYLENSYGIFNWLPVPFLPKPDLIMPSRMVQILFASGCLISKLRRTWESSRNQSKLPGIVKDPGWAE